MSSVEALVKGLSYTNEEIADQMARIRESFGDVPIKRVCGYGRVSTKYEEQESSLRTQHEVFKRYCENQLHKGYILVEEVYEQQSGTVKEKRPKFMEMIHRAFAGEFDVLLFKDSKRFSRNAEDFLNLIEELKRKQIYVVFINEGLDSSQEKDRTMFSMLGMLAENYSNSLHNNLTTALRIRMESEQGRVPGDVFGYKRDSKDTSKASIVPEQAKLLQELFNRYANGEGISAIAEDWIKRDIRTYRGGKMSMFALRRYIRNPLYKGELIMGLFKKSDVRAKRVRVDDADLIRRNRPDLIIIDPELWERCNKIMDANKQKMDNFTHGTIGTRPDIIRNKMFSGGVIKCGVCGRNFVRRESYHKEHIGSDRYTYLMCGYRKYNKKNQANLNTCNNEKSIRLDTMRELISILFTDILSNQDNIRELVYSRITSIIREKQSDIIDYKVEEELEAARKKYKRFVELYKDGQISDSEYMESRKAVKDLENKISNMKSNYISDDMVSEMVDKFLNNMKEVIKSGLKDEDGVDVRLFNMLFKQIVIYEDHIDITLNILKEKSVGKVCINEALPKEHVDFTVYAPMIDNDISCCQSLGAIRKRKNRKKLTNRTSIRTIELIELDNVAIFNQHTNQCVDGIKELKVNCFIE